MGDDVLREDDVVPCGHVILLWQAGVCCLELGSKCLVLLVGCRMLNLAAECIPVACVGFQLRQLSGPERIGDYRRVVQLCHAKHDTEEDW